MFETLMPQILVAPWQLCMVEMKKQAADREAVKRLWHLPDLIVQLGLCAFLETRWLPASAAVTRLRKVNEVLFYVIGDG